MENNKIAIVATNGESILKFRTQLIQEWIKKGHEVICVSIESYDELGESIKKIGAKYYQVSGTRTKIGLFSEVKMIYLYRALFKRIKPEYVYLYMSKPVAYGGSVAILEKVPHINILVNGLENAFYRNGIKDIIVRITMSMFYKYVGKKAENVFFQNHDDYQYFEKNNLLSYSNSYIINGSGVDMEFYCKQPYPKKPVILMISRLLWSKGIREFLDAVSILKEKYSDVEILLVGGLDENDEALTKEELENAIKKNDIKYCGYCDDVRPYLKRCSFFVLPSYHEGTPRSVLEAMATGRAIITTNSPGCRETVEDGVNGFLVPIKDSYTLAKRMIELVCNEELCRKMGENSYNMCKNKYNVKKVNNTINEIMFKR